MEIEINYVQNSNDVNKELVSLRVLKACDLKYFAVYDSTYTSEGKLSNKVRHTYWFLSRTVKAGDSVHLYTGKGKDASLDNTDGTQTHVIYWNLGTPVWNDEGDYVTLVRKQAWRTKRVKEAKRR